MINELAIILMLWIGDNSTYKVIELPEIKFWSEEKIQKKQGISTFAFYYRYQNIIILPKFFDKNIMFHKSSLLHELVHHLQKHQKSRKGRSCREYEAYSLQQKYLEEFEIHNIFIFNKISKLRVKCNLIERNFQRNNK